LGVRFWVFFLVGVFFSCIPIRLACDRSFTPTPLVQTGIALVPAIATTVRLAFPFPPSGGSVLPLRFTPTPCLASQATVSSVVFSNLLAFFHSPGFFFSGGAAYGPPPRYNVDRLMPPSSPFFLNVAFLFNVF